MDNFLIKIISTEMIITERNERMQLLQQLFQGETSRNSIKDYLCKYKFQSIHNFTNFPLNFDQRDTNQKKKQQNQQILSLRNGWK